MSDASRSQPTVLITGAGQRIGRAIALDLARDGWRVAVHYNSSADAANEVVREVVESGSSAAAVQADLSGGTDFRALMADCVKQLGRPTCLINNASIFEHDDIESLTQESWDRHLACNLRAPVFLAQAFARELPAEENGHIVNIIDQRVWRLRPDFFSYTVSKAGLWTVTRTLAQALSPRIRVNAIGPGPTLPSPRQTAASFAYQRASTPLKRGPEPEEIARAVRFILDAPSMTGQMIALDGGQHLAWESFAVTE